MAITYENDKEELGLSKVASTVTTDEKADIRSDADGERIIPGSEGVTEHEYATLKRVADRLPYTAWLVVIVEFAERYALFYEGRLGIC